MSAFEQRRAQTYAELERRIAQEPGVVAVTFADFAPGHCREHGAQSSPPPAPSRRADDDFRTSAVGPGFFEVFDRPIVAGRAFHGATQVPLPEPSSSIGRSRASLRAMRKRIADRRSPPVFRVIRATRRVSGGPVRRR